SQAQQIAQLGHWTLDVGAKRVTGSEEIFKQLPISKEGNNLEELSSCIHKEDRENAMALVERGILFGESWNTEYRVIRNDGKEVWLQSIGEATRDSQGNVYELSGTFQDITRRKKTEKMLIQTNEELEMFFYRTSHDLKSPLASSKGLINLARASQNPEEVKYYLDFIAKAIDKLDNILTDLIEVTRVRRGELEYNEVNICQAIDSVCESYPEFENGEIILRKKIEVHSLMTDKSYLNIILRNLISNAVKYRSKTNKANISFTVLKEKSSVDIIVGDNGIGIRDTVLKDIFEMFFRGTDEQETGAGLGLFIVKNAVEKLKGKINVQSNWGLGTTFTISLPILKD
ncbi:MAG: PAS domain-containing sensor histidine kinase, partial [Cyclobacteriaceae bacterium]|nr:PAS domain-containing sensor histidine kinase [Cyclobacteriaceae bacterium]